MNRSHDQTTADSVLINRLAERVFHWRAGLDRFVTGNGSWTPRWRFNPLRSLNDAFTLLDRAASDYTLSMSKGGTFRVEVRVGRSKSDAAGERKARTITMALAYALGLEIPDKLDAAVSMPARRRSPRSQSEIDA